MSLFLFQNSSNFRTTQMVQVWKVAPGEGAEDWNLFREYGCIGLGWLVDSDYRDYRNEDEILAALVNKHGEQVPGYSAGAAKMIWQFVHEIKTQHVVIASERYRRVVGIGVVTSDYVPPTSAQNPLRQDTTTHRHHIRRVNWLITDPVDLAEKRFFVQSTLWPLKREKLDRIRQAYLVEYPHLRAILDQVLTNNQAANSVLLPEEIVDSPTLFEGARCRVTVNSYERNLVARQKCIEAYGAVCFICKFNFGKTYGPEAEGYIHVHHIRPLSEVNEEYIVDPIEDLRPVCPNCHGVLHLHGKCKSIEEVMRLLSEHK